MKKHVIINSILCFTMLASTLSLTACKSSRKVETNDAYQEWMDSLGLAELDCVKLCDYEEADGIIRLSFEHYSGTYAEGTKGMEEFLSVVSAHNEFIENNPDYFGDLEFEFVGETDENPEICFSSFLTDDDSNDLGRVDDQTLQYLKIDYDTMVDWQDDTESKISIPVLILDMDDSTSVYDTVEFYQFLDRFPDTEQVVVNYSLDFESEDEIACIEEKLPQAKVYGAVNMEITKCYN